jgi:hypothetical protein
MMNHVSLAWLSVVVVSLAMGCGPAKPAVAPVDTATVAKPTPRLEATAPSATASPSVALVATASEGTAEGTFQKTLIAFQEGRLDAAFDFLPPSYQADIDDLVHGFAATMDPEIWSKSFEVLTKVSKLLTTKKTLILSLDNVKRMPQVEAIKPHWDAIAAGIHDFSISEVADLDRLKQSHVRTLLESASGLLKGLPLPQFGDVKVSSLTSSADAATLSFQASSSEHAKEVEFVKVEGKWLPKSIATGWSAGIADAKSRVADIPAQVAAIKPQFVQQLDAISGMLDQLQQSKSPDEFKTAAAPLIFTLAFGAQLAQQAARDATLSPRQENAVQVVINRELKDAELTALKDAILTSMSDTAVQYEMIPNDGKTRCRFTPVTDLDFTVVVLTRHFDGAAIRLDAPTKTIHVDLK